MKTTPKVAQNNAPKSEVNESASVIAHPSTPPQDEPKTNPEQQPNPEPAAEQPAPVNPKVVRIQQLEKHFEHYEQLRKLNTNLNQLKATKAQIQEFIFDSDGAEANRYYQGITIKDDRGKEFNTKNPVLSRLLVNELDTILTAKIKEVENALLEIPLV
ncbi:hypothetical protein FAES_3641 [Fibrella aestuarina BUZ 2]|uniref:Uncharacterized protein n=1 Tax=Fibrella aestuarina BUZ 2 TaxID=1166018 RepID=I0KBZ5_9BACT|nr:hypothetical protein [Fibrella aestuarina]CCH01648.1 hypothetical protein FAES_3641 [Fibrella aestuarina BUZ 2]